MIDSNIDINELSETVVDVLEQNANTYQSKTEDYGESWYRVGEILHLMAGGESVTLDSPDDYARMGLYTRRLDKLCRAFNGEFLSDGLNHEPIVDAHEDESTYAGMHAGVARMQQDVDDDTDDDGGSFDDFAGRDESDTEMCVNCKHLIPIDDLSDDGRCETCVREKDEDYGERL